MDTHTYIQTHRKADGHTDSQGDFFILSELLFRGGGGGGITKIFVAKCSESAMLS